VQILRHDPKKICHSRALIEYNGGPSTAVGTCSVYCLAIDLALNTDKTPKTILVGDYFSKKLLDAEKAFWVLGGDKVGVMSIRANGLLKNQPTLNVSSSPWRTARHF